jgi:hypothetical protein
MTPIPLGILASSGGAVGDYELIATQLLATTSSAVTFSAIPSTYKHLELRMVTRSDYGSDQNYIRVRVNGDSSGNYSQHFLQGTGSAVGSTGYGSQSYIYAGNHSANTATTNSFGSSILHLADYASTAKYKTARIIAGHYSGSSQNVYLLSGAWQNTASVNALEITNLLGSANFVAGSRFSLYGIAG